MELYTFKKAKSIWVENLKNEYNQFVGFYTNIDIDKETSVNISVSARSYYRLFINGEFVSSGPARTGENFCRVDSMEYVLSGNVHIAVEVVALNKPDYYSNDCTLESGLFIGEVLINGQVISATGDGSWLSLELKYRRDKVELLSHSRGVIEVYDLNKDSFNWLVGNDNDFKTPILMSEQPAFLVRRAPYPTYRPIKMTSLVRVNDVVNGEQGKKSFVSMVSAFVNPIWHEVIKDEPNISDGLIHDLESPFSGEMTQSIKAQKKHLNLVPGDNPFSVLFSIEKSEVGFISLEVDVYRSCKIDIICADRLDKTGRLKTNTYVTSYSLGSGRYKLITFEPKLVRFLKIKFTTEGTVSVSYPTILDFTYPDTNQNIFNCSDGEINLIYEASRRTLRLNTLDIFMDCP